MKKFRAILKKLKNKIKQFFINILFLSSIFVIVFLVDNFIINVLTYVFISSYLIIRIMLSPSGLYKKLFSSLPYIFIMILQLVFNVLVVFNETNTPSLHITYRLLAVLLVLIPIYFDKIFTYRSTSNIFFPSTDDNFVISYSELIEYKENINSILRSISKENIQEIIDDLPRHNSFKYINKGSLTNEYFDIAYANQSDLHIYVIISNTGSAASELISIFTKKQYNHISIAFDKELKTIISYNGGERLFPPGLNKEMLEFFNKKADSSIIVYQISCSIDQKKSILQKVKDINETGSSYNLIGLVTKHSHMQNIMFCSQFVYKMLKSADLLHINKKDTEVKPSDIIELDYYRKLEYLYEIKLN